MSETGSILHCFSDRKKRTGDFKSCYAESCPKQSESVNGMGDYHAYCNYLWKISDYI